MTTQGPQDGRRPVPCRHHPEDRVALREPAPVFLHVVGVAGDVLAEAGGVDDAEGNLRAGGVAAGRIDLEVVGGEILRARHGVADGQLGLDQ